MRRCLLFLFVSTTVFTVPSGATPIARGKVREAQAGVSWQFDERKGKYEIPNTKIYLVVGGRRIFIFRAPSHFDVLERQLYGTHNVPASAIAACTGWWAGQGQDLYVIRRKGRLIVFLRNLDEQAPIEPYARLKVIPPPRKGRH